MMTPTYNFYSCCCPGSTENPSNNSNLKNIIELPFASGGAFVEQRDGELKWGSHSFPISTVALDNRTELFVNIRVVPFKYKVLTTSFIKTGELQPGTTNHTMNLEYIVLDMSGTQLRTISTAPVDIVTLASDTWTSANLSNTLSDITINVGEVLVAHFTVDAINNDPYVAYGDCSVLAEII